MALKHLDGFVMVPEEMYRQLAETRQQPPQTHATLATTSGVVDALPESLRERGAKLIHLLQTVMEWNERGEIVNRYTDTPIPGSNVVNAVRHLLGVKGVGDPAQRYVSELARDAHILPSIGEAGREPSPTPIATKTPAKTANISPKTVKTPQKVVKTRPKTIKPSPKKTVKPQEVEKKKKKDTPQPTPPIHPAWLTL
jgi:hypothetical protein